MKHSSAQYNESAIEILRNRGRTRELIVGSGIDARCCAKRVDDNWNIGVYGEIGSNRAIIEVQRIVEKVCLPREISLKAKDEIPHGLINVREPGRRSNRVAIEKLRVCYPVDRRSVNATIVNRDQMRNQPHSGV